MKKICLILVVLIFCASSLATASIIPISKIETNSLKNTSTKTVTICRYGPDRTITPIKMDITLKEEQNIEEILAEKCSELTENDDEIQDHINNLINNTNGTSLFSVLKSKGKGFHFKTKIRFRMEKLHFPRMPKEIPLLVKIKLLIYFNFNKPVTKPTNIIFCKYANDAQANTTITSLVGGENATRYIEGNHSVFALGFIGYTGWLGHFSFTPFNLRPRAFAGYAMLVNCKEPP